jgi:hypothetical protein
MHGAYNPLLRLHCRQITRLKLEPDLQRSRQSELILRLSQHVYSPLQHGMYASSLVSLLFGGVWMVGGTIDDGMNSLFSYCGTNMAQSSNVMGYLLGKIHSPLFFFLDSS